MQPLPKKHKLDHQGQESGCSHGIERTAAQTQTSAATVTAPPAAKVSLQIRGRSWENRPFRDSELYYVKDAKTSVQMISSVDTDRCDAAQAAALFSNTVTELHESVSH